MSYLHVNNPMKVPRGRAPRSRSNDIKAGCLRDVPGTSAEGSGVTAHRERTTACRAHRDLREEGILRREREGQRRSGSWEQPSRARAGGTHEPDGSG